MFQRTNWGWVKDWAGRVFATAWLVTIFALLASGNVLRPGGVMESLPSILLYALAVAIPVTIVAALLMARYSDRKGGKHDPT